MRNKQERMRSRLELLRHISWLRTKPIMAGIEFYRVLKGAYEGKQLHQQKLLSRF